MLFRGPINRHHRLSQEVTLFTAPIGTDMIIQIFQVLICRKVIYQAGKTHPAGAGGAIQRRSIV